MRVDGTLMGMDEDVKKMIPQWRRGHFSMLFDASTQPANVFICDHQKKLFASMAKKKKVRDMDAEVSTDLHSFAASSHAPLSALSTLNFLQQGDLWQGQCMLYMTVVNSWLTDDPWL